MPSSAGAPLGRQGPGRRPSYLHDGSFSFYSKSHFQLICSFLNNFNPCIIKEHFTLLLEMENQFHLPQFIKINRALSNYKSVPHCSQRRCHQPDAQWEVPTHGKGEAGRGEGKGILCAFLRREYLALCRETQGLQGGVAMGSPALK